MSGRRRLAGCAALCAAGLAAVICWGPLAPAPTPVAEAAPATAPAVTLTAPYGPNCACFRGDAALTATAAPSSGRTIDSVTFEYSPAGANSWTAISTDTSAPYNATFPTAGVPGGHGVFDVRAVATDTAGETGTSMLHDRVIANGASVVALDDPGALLRGTITLRAAFDEGGSVPQRVIFERSRAAQENWTEIGAGDRVPLPQPDPDGPPLFANAFTITLDTATLTEGTYDLRVRASNDSGDAFISAPRRDRLVDTHAPTATLSVPAQPLQGEVTLTATATDAGSGVASVRFERSPGGADTWVAIGTRTRPPYTQPFDTRLLKDGSYDLRVVATDRAGNSDPSPVVRDVAVANPGQTTPDQLAIDNVVAPAHDIRLLGTVGSSPQHETWALGTTSAAPAFSDGARLPYTATGAQKVLLRYTDDGGWQIADVLRGSDACPFSQLSGAVAIGQMTASGEAWIALSQKPTTGAAQVAMFHRQPGGRFVRDCAASAALGRLVPGGLSIASETTTQLRLKQTDGGTAYGLIVAPTQPVLSFRVPAPNTGSYSTALRYLTLDGSGMWQERAASLPPTYTARSQDTVTLSVADPTGPGAGWGALKIATASPAKPPFALAQFEGDTWDFKTTKLDALDLTERFADRPQALSPTGLVADRDGVWIGADVGLLSATGRVVARYDTTSGEVTQSWCAALPVTSVGCGAPLDPDHPAALPDRVFDTAAGKVALALRTDFVHVYAHGDWSKVAAPGFGPTNTIGSALFTAPDKGWLPGNNALGRMSASPAPSPLATWSQPNRSTLTSVALSPGAGARVDASGALAVGLDGTALQYQAGAGWLVEPTPPRARRAVLRGVAFSGPTTAFAVGQFGLILRWDGSSWSEDPQSSALTQAELTAVAFDRRRGVGWAVGRFGTILHFDGSSWSEEAPPAGDDGANLTSVAVAGTDVFAVADGHLIVRQADGGWKRVTSELPPDVNPDSANMRLVAGLPDGGVVAAGRSVVIVRQSPSGPFESSKQPIEGIAVALTAFRDNGDVRAFVSVAPHILGSADVGAFPPGDGNLLRQTDSGWQDLSRSQFPGTSAPADGVVKIDPVLAVTSDPTGTAAWAVGGYAGTVTAAALGTQQILPARPSGWRTSQIWRYDSGGSTPSPAVAPTTVSIPSNPDTVSFAFFSSAECKSQCAATRDAQPDVNLRSAAKQIATFAQQPGGPGFAVLGGNARGPITSGDRQAGNGAFDFTHLPDLLAPLGRLPLFAAFGPHDTVPGRANPTQPWADAFAGAPAPFGSRPPADGISPAGSGAPAGAVHRYYAFDANQNGGRLRVIVLDNSIGLDTSANILDASAPGQVAWLTDRLADASAAGLPVVVVASRSELGTTGDGGSVESLLNDAGVLAVFAGDRLNTVRRFPENVEPGTPQMLEYAGGSLGYQEPLNNGVAWYSVSVDTAARTVDVQAIPVIDSLALKPLLGLTVARSSTLAFEAVGRRPVSTLATPPNDDRFPGFDNYVGIPAPSCGSRPCVKPSYSFESTDKTIGDFVTPSGAGSRLPKLDNNGRPIPSSSSGLFCAFNSGTTTVSVTSGLLKASLPITVQAGGIGRPCGTVFRPGVGRVVVVPRSSQTRSTSPSGDVKAPPPAPPLGAASPVVLPKIALPVPPPAPAPAAVPKPQPRPVVPAAHPVPQPPAAVPPVFAVPPLPVLAVPPLPAAAQPIPPGGSATANAAAKRKEKARKHASQSANFTVRTTSVSGEDWFYPAVGGASVLALLLVAAGIRPIPRPRTAEMTLSDPHAAPRRRDGGWT